MQKKYFIGLLTIAFYIPAFSSAFAQQASPYEIEYQSSANDNKFRVAVGGGYAYRLGKAQDELSKKLHHGFAVDADAQYFFRETWGVGLNANFCSANTSGNNLNNGTANYKETQNFTYTGLSLVGRNESEKFSLITNIGFGPLFFNTDMNINGRNFVGKKVTAGINGGIAGEYRINPKTGIGIKVSYVMATIEDIDIEGEKKKYDEKISLSNLMGTLFISFRL